MHNKLKPVGQQTIVITGASSGIGLATAHLAAEKGANVVLSSRNAEDLSKACAEINARGAGKAVSVVADVADPEEVRHIADVALSEFGSIDTWVNNAGVSMYGKLTESHLEDKRRLFDVNFWGVIHGCRAALPHMRDKGGCIVNIGSVLSQRVIPIQGIYTASKHAVKAYTDALRMELEEEGCPVVVSLVMPAAIDTPYVEHAKNLQPGRATHMPPVYAPEVVARAILRCARSGQRDVFVGGAAKLYTLMEKTMPRITDLFMEKTMVRGQYVNEPDRDPSLEGLNHAPSHEGDIHGTYKGRVFQHSWFTFASQHKSWMMGALGTVAAFVGMGIFARALKDGFGGAIRDEDLAPVIDMRPVQQEVDRLQQRSAA